MDEKHRNVLVLTITIVLMCKGNVYGESIARNKNVTMSSLFGVWDGSFAVDGDYRTLPDACQCCAATEAETDPWIQIDLGREEYFTRIVVYGRTDGHTGKQQSLSGLKVQKLTSGNNNEDIATIPTSDTFIKFYEFHIGNALTARYIRFLLVGANRLLVLCEVDVFNGGVISLEKPANISTIFTLGTTPWSASRAVDGNIRTDAGGCDCCTASHFQTDPWLYVDFQRAYNVSRIVIYGRTDVEYPGQDFAGSTIYLDNNLVDTIPTTAGWIEFWSVIVTPKKHASSVKFVLNGKTPQQLLICELSVYEDCADGTYGKACDKECHCYGDQCPTDTGVCPSGICEPGYRGETCSEKCSNGYFGPGCVKQCHCEKDTCPIDKKIKKLQRRYRTQCSNAYFGPGCVEQCHCEQDTCPIDTGICPTGICQPGFRGLTCSEECENGTYGRNCSEECGNCSINEICDKVNGDCRYCIEGYNETDLTCKTECKNGTYGRNCSNECGNCTNNEICDKVNGDCSYCMEGFNETDLTCKTECTNGTYGRNCSEECGNCTNNEICDKVNGDCRYCVEGYNETDLTCKTECTNGTYGRNCTEECGNCTNNEICDKVNGHCKNCIEGYKETDLTCKTECSNGTYGRNCTEECGNCTNNEICDKVNGHCKNCIEGYNETDLTCKTECRADTFGQNCTETCGRCNDTCRPTDGSCKACVAGYNYTDIQCNTICDDGYYGFECNNTCGQHCQNYSCHHISGNCKCVQGYGGKICEDEQPTHMSEANTATALIAGVTSSVVIVAVIVVAVVTMQIRRLNNKSNKAHGKPESLYANDMMFSETSLVGNNERRAPEDTNGKHEEENEYYNVTNISHGILIRQLWDYIATKKQDNNEEFSNEFAELSDGLIFPYNDALANRQKNRYREMFPYDHSRVHLKVEANGESEFINASHIDGYIEERKFIASQGPTKVMVDDFWRMVWQQKTNKIVMLTNLVETGTVKCIQYWPDEGTLTFERINITLIKESLIPDYTVRILEIKQDNEKPRKVVQYHYKAWPDKDVPDSTWSLVQFWRKVFKEKEMESGPVVVHCSAGVGRTGTFIALDNLYHQAVSRGSVTPFDVVEMLRQQRVKMVQTCEQYVYLHEAVADALLFGTHHVWQSQFSDYYDFMIKKDKEDGQIRLKVQYQITNNSLEEKRPIDGKDLCAAEIDEYRPKKYNGDKKGNSDITLLPGIGGGNIYLLTRIPDDGTMGECLEIVDNHNVKTIITLVEDKQSNKNPWSGTKQVYGEFQLSRDSEKGTVSFVERTFTYTKDLKKAGSSNPQTRSISQFDLALSLDVSQDSRGAESVIRLLDSVCTKHPHMSSNERIMIQSSDIINKGSVICAILNEKMRMSKEGGHINILESVISLRRRDRSCISTYEQYRYIHDVILQIVENTEKPVVELSDDDCNIYQNM